MIDFKTLLPGTLQNLIQPHIRKESRTWYRAIQLRFTATALQYPYTQKQTSRFSAGTPTKPAHPLLYLAENQQVALLEVAAIFSPLGSGNVVPNPNPNNAWALLSVSTQLSKIANLTTKRAQQVLETNAQELTGDWIGYQLRKLPGASVTAQTGIAPTQRLAAELYKLPDLQGFLTLSAKAPDRRNLVLFPDKIKAPTSDYVEFIEPLDDGTTKIHRIP